MVKKQQLKSRYLRFRMDEHEEQHLKYLAMLEHMSLSGLIRKLIREHGDRLGVSFLQLSKMGMPAYHTQRMELEQQKGRNSELTRELKRLRELKETEEKLYGRA
jgi:2-oxoglutarate dehydrogenase complex dehydrogenase (E1) component-like enzyme